VKFGLTRRFSYTEPMSTSYSPEQFDVMACARSNARLTSMMTRDADGAALTRFFSRLETEASDPQGLATVSWAVQTELRPGADGQPQPWLHLEAEAGIRMTCQRCLTAADVRVTADRWFRFVTDEATAAVEDDESDEDVLALEPRFNLVQLVEDELLMAMPLVPMHTACPVEVPTSAGEEEFQAVLEARPSPFEALAQLKTAR